jgi:hypothetical protein
MLLQLMVESRKTSMYVWKTEQEKTVKPNCSYSNLFLQYSPLPQERHYFLFAQQINHFLRVPTHLNTITLAIKFQDEFWWGQTISNHSGGQQ